MAYEMNNGDLSLWVNDRKGSDRHPDYKGKALLDGKLYDVAIWSRKDRNGNQFYSGKIEPRQQAQNAEAGYVRGAQRVRGESQQRDARGNRPEIYRNPPALPADDLCHEDPDNPDLPF